MYSRIQFNTMESFVTESISKLVMMMDSYPSHDEDERFVFVDYNGNPNVYARKIGKDLYKMGGTNLLHNVMNRLVNIVNVKIENGEDWLAYDLRQLEFCWNNIGDWQA